MNPLKRLQALRAYIDRPTFNVSDELQLAEADELFRQAQIAYRAHQRTAPYRPNDHVTRDMAPLGAV